MLNDLQAQSGVPLEEWRARVELAACFRLVHRQGWSDLMNTHISARVPGTPNHFLLNPYGLLFNQITASSLVKIDLDGNVVGESPHLVNRGGFVIHSALYMGRPDVQCVLHTHTAAGVGVAAQKKGLLPLTQQALQVLGTVSYHEYESFAVDVDERQRLVRDLGANFVLILRNHGLLTVGRTIGEAWVLMYWIERACRMQLAVQSAHSEVLQIDPAVQKHAIDYGRRLVFEGTTSELEWRSLVRSIDEAEPSYRA